MQGVSCLRGTIGFPVVLMRARDGLRPDSGAVNKTDSSFASSAQSFWMQSAQRARCHTDANDV